MGGDCAACISGVTRSGLFIKLADTGADGFVPAATIGADYYRFDERRHAMVGDRTGETYRLGDPVEVKLVEAAPVAGALRFELLSEGAKDSAKGSRKAAAKDPRDRGRSKRGPERTERRTTPRLKGKRRSKEPA